MIHYPSWLNKVYLSQYWTKKLLSSRWWLLQAEKNLSVKVKGLALLSYWLTESGQDSGFWLCEALRVWLHFIGYQMKGYLWGMLGTANQVCGCLLVFGNLLSFQQHTWMMWTPGCPALLVLRYLYCFPSMSHTPCFKITNVHQDSHESIVLKKWQQGTIIVKTGRGLALGQKGTCICYQYQRLVPAGQPGPDRRSLSVHS